MKPEHLTAWALNELSDDERAQLEAELHASTSLHEQAKDTQAFCSLLTQTLGSENAALTVEQREALLAAVPMTKAPVLLAPVAAVNGSPSPMATASILGRRSLWRHPALAGIGAAAACWAAYVGITSHDAAPDKSLSEIVTTERQFRVYSGSEEDFKKAAAEVLAKKPVSASSPLKPTDPKAAPLGNIAIVKTDALKLEGTSTYTGGATLSGIQTASGGGAGAGKPMAKSLEPGSAMDLDTRAVGPRRSSGVVLAGIIMTAGSRTVAADSEQRPAIGYVAQADSAPRIEPVSSTAASANMERYAAFRENGFLDVVSAPLSTFGVDVDSASFSNVRRYLNSGQLPPVDAVRLEELINYFPYNYEAPGNDDPQPFKVHVDMAEAPWAPQHRIARIGIKGREAGLDRPRANLVFLVDVSGSMTEPNKLPLVKRSLRLLVEQLRDDDYVSIVTYAGSTEVKLASTAGKEKNSILSVIEEMQSGGSTNGAAGILLAYTEAQKHFAKGGVNRVVLCTDGDFNVGASSPEALEVLIKEKAASGVFLSVLGYGAGNLQDRTMMTLADKGNGNYAYIDSLSEARKVLVEQMQGTLVTIAKDVKIQVEFNPALVRSYRLIGYEKRALAKEDFNNDRKDAGEIGAGHTITALYEVVPVGAPLPSDRPLVDDLKYQPKSMSKELPSLVAKAPLPKLEGLNDEVMTVKLRYKAPDGELSKMLEVPVKDGKGKLVDAAQDFQFATAVAGFGLMLRDSEHRGTLTWDQVRKLAIHAKGADPLGYRGEFIQLIDKANGLSGRP